MLPDFELNEYLCPLCFSHFSKEFVTNLINHKIYCISTVECSNCDSDYLLLFKKEGIHSVVKLDRENAMD